MLSKTSFKRGFARVAVAGALVAVPLGALAVTASAATPDSAATTISDQIPLEGAAIGDPHRGPGDEFPGRPRDDRDGHRGPGDWHRGDGDRHGDGPGQFFDHVQPPTGSAG